ncbi:uncharacterized protein LOC107365413 [Tetranychus urticae]|nr:uncharacterized protein LOC107365413 [Tetranychus urticae]
MLIIKNETPSPLNNNGRIVWGIFVNSEAMVPESLMEYYPHLMFTAHIQDIFSVNTRNGQRFYLQYGVCYEHQISKRISMCYKLVEERDVPEEGCVGGVCQYQCTESYFRRLKDLVSNDEMNAKITQLVQPLFESGNSAEVYRIFRDFNIKQYLYPSCDEGYRRQLAVNGHAHQIDLYPRTRG